MGDFRTTVTIANKKFDTLSDILPEKAPIKILFIAKTPALKSVQLGHYFQGRQGTMFWNRLSEYNILNIPGGAFADEFLVLNNCGITDVVKVPRNYGNEPSNEEYKDGFKRILDIANRLSPKVIVFVYKKVLDKIMELNFNNQVKANYGFNPLLEKYFNSKIFVFPMPGTPCKSSDAIKSMLALQKLLK